MGLFFLLLIGGCASSDTIIQEHARLCNAFYLLAQDVENSGKSQSVLVFKERPMEVLCSREENDAAQNSYCAAVLQSVSREFTHAYPWKLKQCLLSKGVTPYVEITDEYTGLVDRDKIVRLAGTLSSDIQMELVFEASPGQSVDGVHDRYWGRYILVLSR